MVNYIREFWSKLDGNIKNRERRRQRVMERRRQMEADRRELSRLQEIERIRNQEPDPPTSG
jgi:hypothetical protein